MVSKPILGHPVSDPDGSTLRDVAEILRLDHLLDASDPLNPRFTRRRVKAGDYLYRFGEAIDALYVVRLGFLKTVLHNSQGDERIFAFPMQGDLLGFASLCHDHYVNDTIALTDCDLVRIPIKELLLTGYASAQLDRLVCLAASRVVSVERGCVGLAITVRSEARVARFLAMLAKRYTDLGYSSRNFILPMTRRDLGSYLGLTLETVSRSLSALAGAGIISVDRREIRILQPDMLKLPTEFPFSIN